MRHIGSIGLALVTSVALAGITASGATATAIGPAYLVVSHICESGQATGEYPSRLRCLDKEEKGTYKPGWSRIEERHYRLEPFETLALEAINVGVTSFKSSVATATCTSASVAGNIEGGAPGTGTDTMTFTGCKVEGKTEAECNVRSVGEPVGTEKIKVNTELVYLGSKEEASKEEGKVGALLKPSTGSTFVELEFAGTHCPLGVEGKHKVLGSALAELSPVGGVAMIAHLILPSEALGHAFTWKKEGEVSEVKPKLTLLGVAVTPAGEEEARLDEQVTEPEGREAVKGYELGANAR
jgi:hypothetical protein